MTYRMVIDVEAIGLYGPTFAIGFVVFDEQGVTIDEGLMACNPVNVRGGDPQDRRWVNENCPVMPYEVHSAVETREWFWSKWLKWSALLVQMWVDCGYPVEMFMLNNCVAHDFDKRKWLGPYPLHEIGTAALLCGYDPTFTWPRLATEQPAHNPLHDARQSARLLIQYLRKLDVMKGEA